MHVLYTVDYSYIAIIYVFTHISVLSSIRHGALHKRGFFLCVPVDFKW